MKTKVFRALVMFALIIVGFTLIMAEPAPYLTGYVWLASLIISKAVGTASLLLCGWLGRRWYHWDSEIY